LEVSARDIAELLLSLDKYERIVIILVMAKANFIRGLCIFEF
jgi:hypothetical protein